MTSRWSPPRDSSRRTPDIPPEILEQPTRERPSQPQEHTAEESNHRRYRFQTPLRLRGAAPPCESCNRRTDRVRLSVSCTVPEPQHARVPSRDRESLAPSM